MTPLDAIRTEIASDPSNAWAAKVGYEPVYAAAPEAHVVVV